MKKFFIIASFILFTGSLATPTFASNDEPTKAKKECTVKKKECCKKSTKCCDKAEKKCTSVKPCEEKK